MPLNSIVRTGLYVPDATVTERRDSAFQLVRQILRMTGLTRTHHREQLTIALWKWTEAIGVAPYAKYNIPLCSVGVKKAAATVKINHEHVWPRKWIIDRLMAARDWKDEELREFLERYGVACTVSVEEHARLGAVRGEGWQRYVNAGIEVWDLRAQQPLAIVDPSTPAVDDALTDSEADEHDETASLGVELSVRQAFEKYSRRHAELLTRLTRTMEFANGVAVVGRTRNPEKEVGDYVRIHDALIEEPTPTAAFVHWSGLVSIGLQIDDIPAHLAGFVRAQANKRFGVSCAVKDAESLEAAEDLVALALEAVRAEYEA